MQPVIAIRVFIASPSDVKTERDIAVQVVTEWNAANSLNRDTLVEAVRMETHARAALGNHPQELINQQLLERCDFLIAIFWSKLGTPTNKEKSGSVHEIKDFAKQKGADNVMVFFAEKDLPHNIDPDELRRIKDFKKEMQDEGFNVSYQSDDDFRQKLRQQIEICLNGILSSEKVKRLWSEKAVMDEQSKLLFDSSKKHLDLMDESRRSYMKTNQAIREKALGIASTSEPIQAAQTLPSRDKFRDDLRKVIGRLTKRYNDFGEQQDIESAKSLFRQVSRKLNDIFVEYCNVITESESSELFRLIRLCGKIADETPSQTTLFWTPASSVANELDDFVELL